MLPGGLFCGVMLWAGLLCAGKTGAAEKPAVRVSAGLQGSVKVGRWAPVQVRTADKRVASVAVEAADPNGNLVRFPLEEIPQQEAGFSGEDGRLFRGLFLVGKLNGVIRLRLELRDGTVVSRRLKEEKDGDEPPECHPPLRQSVALILLLGDPTGFEKLQEERRPEVSRGLSPQHRSPPVPLRMLRYNRPAAFPADVRALDAVDAVVITGPYPFDRLRDAALQQWVREGGHLVLCRGSRLEVLARQTLRRVTTAAVGTAGAVPFDRAVTAALPPSSRGDALLANWLPMTVLGESRLGGNDLSRLLRSYTGEKTATIQREVPVARLADPGLPAAMLAGQAVHYQSVWKGRKEVRDRREPLILQLPYGFGLVTFCGLDLNRPPISEWEEVDAMGRQLLRKTLERVRSQNDSNPGRRISRSGITDLATQLHTIQEDFPEVRRLSTWKTMGLLLVYILLIGPIDYLVVHRWLKRPRWTWVTFPLLVAGATGFALWKAEAVNGRAIRLNQLHVVDIDATPSPAAALHSDRQAMVVRSWLTLYSPQTRRYRLQVVPHLPGKTTRKTGTESSPVNGISLPAETQFPTVGWSGVTENIFGGMYRRGGLQMRRLDYMLRPQTLTVDDLPLPLWSAQTLQARFRCSATGLVHAHLQETRSGALRGTLRHDLPVPLEDWVLVYDKFLYRPEGTAAPENARLIRPGAVWPIRQPGVIQMLLENQLKRARFETEEFETKDSVVRQVQQRYDPRGKDLDYLLRILSFHEAIQGRKYTTLDNVPLAAMDFSRLLPYRRAVLIGRVRWPAAQLVEPAGNQQSNRQRVLPATRSHTFVRIVLPVRPAD